MINWRYRIQHTHCTYRVQTSTKVVGPGIEQPRVCIASVCSKPNYCQAFQQRGRALNCCTCSSHSCCLSHHLTPPTVTQLSTLTAVDHDTADNISNNAQEWQEQNFCLWQLWATGWHLSNDHRSSTAGKTFLLAELWKHVSRNDRMNSSKTEVQSNCNGWRTHHHLWHANIVDPFVGHIVDEEKLGRQVILRMLIPCPVPICLDIQLARRC
jgi:hypothetical protein